MNNTEETAARFPPTLATADMLTPQVRSMCRVLGIESESLIHFELHLDSKPAPVVVTARVIPVEQVAALRKLLAEQKGH